MKILICGSTGFIGSQLIKLLDVDHELFLTTRYPRDGYIAWDPMTSLLPAEVKEVDLVINLIGENIGQGRWLESKKEMIYQSRVQGLRNIVQSFISFRRTPYIISASAVGIYSNKESFLKQVCTDWERELLSSEFPYSIIRMGVVLSPYGGLLKSLIFPFKLGLGAIMGNGNEPLYWVSLEDVLNSILWLVSTRPQKMIFDIVARRPSSNEEFARVLARRLRRPLLLKVPPFLLKILLGEKRSLLLDSYSFKANSPETISQESLEEYINRLSL